MHEHWSFFSYDRARKALVLRQFHQEGFVNQYVLDTAERSTPTCGTRTESPDLSAVRASYPHGLICGACRRRCPGSILRAVLNGIAYDAARKRLFVTGKLWPRLFE